MREESRAGEGQLLALGDLAKVMVLSAFLFLSPLQTAPDLFLPTLSPYLSHFHSPSSSLRILPPNSAALANRWCPMHPTCAFSSWPYILVTGGHSTSSGGLKLQATCHRISITDTDRGSQGSVLGTPWALTAPVHTWCPTRACRAQ